MNSNKNKLVNKIITFLLCFYIILLPFEEAFAFGGVTILRIVSLAIMLISLIAAGYQIKFKSFLIPLTIWMLFSLLSFFWSLSASESWRFFKIYFIQYLMITIVFSIPQESIDLSKIFKSFVLCGFIASTLLFVFPSSTITNEGRRAIVLFGTMLDPNIISGIVIIGVLFSLLLALKVEGIKRIILFLIAGYESLGIFYTGSRGGALSLTFGIFVLGFMHRKLLLKSIKSFAIVLLGLIVVVIVINLIPENLIFSRFSINVLFGQNEIGSHSRMKIWSYIPERFIQKPILGWGAGNFATVLSMVYKYTAGHNMYFIVLLETGLVGLLLFLWFIFKMIRDVGKINSAILPVVFSILFCCLFLDGLTDKFFWATVLLAALVLNNKESSFKALTKEKKFNNGNCQNNTSKEFINNGDNLSE